MSSRTIGSGRRPAKVAPLLLISVLLLVAMQASCAVAVQQGGEGGGAAAAAGRRMLGSNGESRPGSPMPNRNPGAFFPPPSCC
ncbi:hypothetical protein GUJ93_ZPchr0010g8675 [Zizania palustris]|uniref:Uncharacterized protein n=1 Tax=Zizania palustris TaxID=103762 RepID=A0A8J5W8U6_ZIZPA|nr:hypothetical protein GUJ93_ZPchr0010g9656 [Zizania palustris]KAG8085221.1 hypothetical protein GUJ93_ZPchr0010g8675 [Zizania palustris]